MTVTTAVANQDSIDRIQGLLRLGIDIKGLRVKIIDCCCKICHPELGYEKNCIKPMIGLTGKLSGGYETGRSPRVLNWKVPLEWITLSIHFDTPIPFDKKILYYSIALPHQIALIL